jgi:hypothetical protein
MKEAHSSLHPMSYDFVLGWVGVRALVGLFFVFPLLATAMDPDASSDPAPDLATPEAFASPLLLSQSSLSPDSSTDDQYEELMQQLQATSDQNIARAMIWDFVDEELEALWLSDEQVARVAEIFLRIEASRFADLSPESSRAILEAIGIDAQVIAKMFENYNWNEIEYLERLSLRSDPLSRLRSSFQNLSRLNRLYVVHAVSVITLGVSFKILDSLFFTSPRTSNVFYLSVILAVVAIHVAAVRAYGPLEDLGLNSETDPQFVRENIEKILRFTSEELGTKFSLPTDAPSESLMALLRACYRTSAQ